MSSGIIFIVLVQREIPEERNKIHLTLGFENANATLAGHRGVDVVEAGYGAESFEQLSIQRPMDSNPGSPLYCDSVVVSELYPSHEGNACRLTR